MPRWTVSLFLVLATVFALAGCEGAPRAAARPDPHTIAEEALNALSSRTAVAYDLGGGSVLSVTAKGLAQGTLPVRGLRIGALRAEDELYLRAPPAHWQAEGMAAARAAEYGARWARSTLAFDPGSTFTPASLAKALRAALPKADRFARITLAGGLDVLDSAGLRFTATRPYRLVSFPATLLGPAVEQTVGDAEIQPHELRPDELGGLRTGFDRAVDSLGQPFVAGPVVATSVTDNSLGCAGNGTCTDTVQVSTRLLGSAPNAAARLVLTSSVTSARLGSQNCGQEVVVPLDAPTTMSCSVRFALPRLDGTATVSTVPVVTAEPVATVDPVGFKQAAATELGR